MSIALVAACEAARTQLTGVRLFTCMSSDVSGQVITPAECTTTHRARKRPLAAVNASVPRQLVATRETATAVRYRAREGLGRADRRHAVSSTRASACHSRRFLVQFLCDRCHVAAADVGYETLQSCRRCAVASAVTHLTQRTHRRLQRRRRWRWRRPPAALRLDEATGVCADYVERDRVGAGDGAVNDQRRKQAPLIDEAR